MIPGFHCPFISLWLVMGLEGRSRSHVHHSLSLADCPSSMSSQDAQGTPRNPDGYLLGGKQIRWYMSYHKELG